MNRKKSDVAEAVWNAMKTEYISSDNSSYRLLESKYGVSYNKIRRRGLDEDWQGKREEFKLTRGNKSLELVAEYQAEQCAEAFKVANKLLEKISQAVDEILAIDTESIKRLTGALKDLKEIGVFRSDMDKLEQQARIRKLQKDAETEEKDTTITVVIDDELQRLCK